MFSLLIRFHINHFTYTDNSSDSHHWQLQLYGKHGN